MANKYQYLRAGKWKACQTGTTTVINKRAINKGLSCLERFVITGVIILGLILILSGYAF